jgi:two-component system sensor histidine kinase/response regulator
VLGMPGLVVEEPVAPVAAPVPAPPLITRHTLVETRSAARVLVAEDNIINQKLTVRMLEKLGFQSDVVGNGQEALAALAHGSYAIVLMDCQMPLVDGFEATRLIRKREAAGRESATADCPETHHIPIVALTANAMRGDRERCLAAGMDDYLTKPVRKEDLKGILDRWISAPIQVHVNHADRAKSSSDMKDTRPLSVIFDMASMLRNIGSDTELLEELVELFLQRYQTMLEEIRAALVNGDRQAVEQAAHMLKGTASNLCASEVVLAAGQLEALGRLGKLVEGPIIYVQIEKAVLRLVRLFEERGRNHTESRKHAA